MKHQIDIKFPYFVGKIPFYHQILNMPYNNNFPDFVDFTLDINNQTGLLVQKYDIEIEDMLKNAYVQGSQIIGYMDEYDLGVKYTQDFLNFILKHESSVNICTILEIGCGTGYLLHKLKQKGATVIGIEPGGENIPRNRANDIQIINDYYPSQNIKDEFDIIIFSNVLEHIKDPKEFLTHVSKQLKANGRIYCSVPNCEIPIKYGDISMLIHEHYNYFVDKTLENTFLNSIKCKVNIEKSSFGSQLYALINKSEDNSNSYNCLESLELVALEYINKISRTELLFTNFLLYIKENQKKLGIYVPARAMNMLSKIFNEIIVEDIVFIDDDENITGKYFPGFNNKIYNKNHLKDFSLDYILIMSYTFGEEIKESIKSKIHNDCKIIKYEELFGGKGEWEL